MMKSAGANLRMAVTGRSASPTCTPAAPAASAMSARSLTITGTETALIMDRVISTTPRGAALLRRTWTLVAPPRTAAATRSTRSRRRSSASSVIATRRRIEGSSISRYRLVLDVLVGVRFFEVVLFDFLVVVFAPVVFAPAVLAPAVFALFMLVFGVVLLAALTGVFALRVGVPAIASIRGAGFLAGAAARTCRTALVCSSRVVRNSWCPSGLATKYRYGTAAGFAAADRLAA